MAAEVTLKEESALEIGKQLAFSFQGLKNVGADTANGGLELEEEKQNQFNFKYLTDSKIRNEVEMISNTKKVLDNLFFNPSDSVIKRIKDFSSALNFAEKIN